MNEQLPENKGQEKRMTRRTIKQNLKVIFFCMTAIPFFVFAFVYFRIGTFNTALSGALIVLALILMLQGFIVFRKMADHIERLSATMSEAEAGRTERVDNTGETKELALIAETFNRTLSKLEKTARELAAKTGQTRTLHEIREIVSRTIQMEEVAGLVLEKAMKAVNAQAGYLAVKQEGARRLIVAASSGVASGMPSEIELDPSKTLAGLVLGQRSPLLIEDIEQDERLKTLNVPDIALPRLVYLPLEGKDAPIGTLAMGRGKNNPQFEEEDVQFLQVLLQQVAYNFENAKLYQDLLQSKKELEIALHERKKTQDQLLASARMAAFGELSVSIANELNNPLTGILGYSNLLLTASGPSDQEAREYLEMIQTLALRAGQVTRSLLDIVSDKPGTRVSTDINELLKKSLILTKARMSDSGIKLTLKLQDNLPRVRVDPVQMEHVFFSLICNALNALTGKYRVPTNDEVLEPGPAQKQMRLRIETRKGKGKITIAFADTGCGMAQDDLARIFDPFFSTQKKTSQVGLGLWVSRMVLKTHGGAIAARSVPGKGSQFVVVLPAGD